MKRGLFLLILAGVLSFCSNAQNIIQISSSGTGNNNNQQQECPFRINGICSSEDIGGVNFELKKVGETYNGPYIDYKYDYVATNYNPFPVTVLILENYTVGGGRYRQEIENVLTVVLKPEESKRIRSHANEDNHHIQSITRRLGGK